MTIDTRRIRAVAASWRGVPERVQDNSDDSVWNTAAFDNAVSLLGGAMPNTDFYGHVSTTTNCPRPTTSPISTA